VGAPYPRTLVAPNEGRLAAPFFSVLALLAKTRSSKALMAMLTITSNLNPTRVKRIPLIRIDDVW
jgi:hypothetical protein